MKTVMAHGMTLAALALSPGSAAGDDRHRPLCRYPKGACRAGPGTRRDAPGLCCG
ncbi:hypothetical protein [Ralstonia solanacearum]|uniref:hypothetical protein n=1 Tax=Ralstonia solanacearum TaxID=305 RepID=UPI0004AFD987|nr:hypothetical protein [Ralstonia solanacearum]MCL9845630.1 tannase/feruloyl esterase family alpha/beta hydrolase [Ralstonia solanacearum]MCL9848029.1 tannase/feruloyl esterase family alpha/beta hydrolase [Ralstonia solanacearum]MCL9854878.1 tannase/feruloyl esterase family alpha/beta hydrolase [Ralstonia solanacearum]MCL9860433.1 tannase/feruloyl esterase family alpha/beta hydrolase [Ralstonia solanacearum]MCL9864810.1 tannase/feruloyl esterase family alpha/beta hydrolase [Ralstonia solanace